jgi:ATP-dependent Lhr-like helicase
MGLPVTIETRTGDTPHSKRQRQHPNPPDILITTPEQISLLVADPHAAHLLRQPAHASSSTSCIPSSPRSAACCCRWPSRACAGARPAGGSASASPPPSPIPMRCGPGSPPRAPRPCPARAGPAGRHPTLRILSSEERVPWSGHSARYAVKDIYAAIKRTA